MAKPPVCCNLLRGASVLLLCTGLVAGCASGGGGNGGGSGGGNNAGSGGGSAPPSTALNPGDFRTAEYLNTSAVVQLDAARAYAAGATGAGVGVAVIDSGIVVDTSDELAGKVAFHYDATTGTVGPGAPPGTRDHGTAVAAIIGMRKNNRFAHGVAYDAPLYDLNIFGGAENATQLDLINAIDTILGRGPVSALNVRVANMSFAASSLASVTVDRFVDLAEADILIVKAAGNDGSADPAGSAQIAARADMLGRMLIVGSVGRDGVISSFSNRAGAFSDYYVVALGELLEALDVTGEEILFSGTSAAAPVVSGLAALILDAAPHLTADQVANIIKTTAIDRGAPGVDRIYGHGEVSVTGALNPVGALAVPTGTTVDGSASGLSTAGFSLAGAFGTPSSGKVAAMDDYGRFYTVSLGDLAVRRAAPSPFERSFGWNSWTGARASRTVETGFVDLGEAGTVGFSEHRGRAGAPSLPLLSLIEPATDGGNALFPTTGAGALPQLGFFDTDHQGWSAAHQSGAFSVAASLVQSESTDPLRSDGASTLYQSMAGIDLGLAHAFAGAGRLSETASVLGSTGSGVFGSSGAETDFLTAGLNTSLGPITLAGAYTRALLAEASFGSFSRGGDLAGQAFHVSASAPLGGGLIGLRLSQPLRVGAGTMTFDLPVARTIDGKVISERQHVGFEPDGRQLDLEAAYWQKVEGTGIGGALSWGIDTLYSHEPNHAAGAGAEAGAMVRIVYDW